MCLKCSKSHINKTGLPISDLPIINFDGVYLSDRLCYALCRLALDELCKGAREVRLLTTANN